MFSTDELNERYPLLARISDPVKAAEREIVGRDREIVQLMASMSRPELCNALLIAEPGTGKTALVQAAMLCDTDRLYLEVDPARMISDAGNAEQMAAHLKRFFDEAEQFVKHEQQQLVLFIDEFHQIIQLSDAAVEAIKPVLAASGARGIRVIAATTNEEFHKHISSNLPLVERLQRINLRSPDQDTTVQILQGMAARYEVADEFFDDHIFRQIYEYTERYMPASSQPRKSILILDAMVGWHRFTKRPMDRALLADVLQESLGVNVSFKVDGTKIKEQLDSVVLSQDAATRVVAQRLQLSVADLNDKTRPEASFLFSGSTGTGKHCVDSTQVPVLFEDGTAGWKAHGDLVPGKDRVFGRHGRPVDILGHFPQGVQDVYRVSLTDGRSIDVGGPHLWAVYTAKQRAKKHAGCDVQPMVLTTDELVVRGVTRTHPGDTREHLKFFIPANEPVQWPTADLEVDPYVLGVLIGNGCLTSGPLQGEQQDNVVQTKHLFGSIPELMGVKSAERRIPQKYLLGSIDQRWELVRGLFDTDGTIQGSGRFNVSYSTFSEGLARDVQTLLYSLGVSSSVKTLVREKDNGGTLVEYVVHVKVGNRDKVKFFSLPRKRERAERAAVETTGRERVKKFDMVGISAIEKLDEQQSSSCIYVDDDEHLYQAGDFIVTHNTELTKQLAHLLFGDAKRHLIRFDMTEFAEDSSLQVFRSELTKRVWDRSHAVILFDEVEKASALVTRVLLQVLDDGRLSDDNNREVSFLNTYIVLTTNAGSEIYKDIAQYSASDTGSGKELEDYKKLIRRSITSTTGDNRFPPELLGRIDAVVPFQPLSLETQKKIVRKKLLGLAAEVLVKHNVQLNFDKRVLQYLIEDKGDSDSNAGGARGAVARMTDEVSTQVAKFINEHPQERHVGVMVNGDLVSDDKRMLKSDVRIEVVAAR